MVKHKETGLKGEQIAASFLEKKGYRILHKNWFFGKKEVDIIAQRGRVLIFVEVKTRSNLSFGFPEESVGIKKQHDLKTAAEGFLEQFPEFEELQFDIVSILLDGNKAREIVHFKEAFY